MRARVLVVALTLVAPAAAGPRNPLEALRLEDLSVTRARPLFAPTRRPPAPPAAQIAPAAAMVAVSSKPPEPPPYDLVGVVVGKQDSYVVLRRHGGDKAARYRLGDDAEGWRVGAIGVRSATLERDGRAQSLALAPGAGPSAAASAPQKPPDAPTPTPLAANFRPSAHHGRN